MINQFHSNTFRTELKLKTRTKLSDFSLEIHFCSPIIKILRSRSQKSSHLSRRGEFTSRVGGRLNMFRCIFFLTGRWAFNRRGGVGQFYQTNQHRNKGGSVVLRRWESKQGN